MLPRKYKFVNWQDGMKISRQHFIALENALHDHLRDAISLGLTNYNYGLLPPADGESKSLEYDFTYDSSAKEVSIKVLQCWAVSPGGTRIEIKKSSHLGQDDTNAQPVLKYSIDNFHTLIYDVVVSVNPFGRVGAGQPDPEESPLRNPWVLPKYAVEIIPYPRTQHSEQGAYQLTIGRIEVEAGQLKVVQQHVPPCSSLMSHPYLVSLNSKVIKFMDELEATIIKIIQRKKQQAASSALDADVVYIAEKIAYLLAEVKDQYKLESAYQPPLFLVESSLRLARTLSMALECCGNKYDLLDFYCNWLDWNPGRFENALSDILKIDYRHEEMFESLKRSEECYQLLLTFFNQIWEMSLPKQIKIKAPLTYGWLIDHTKGKQEEDFSFTIQQKRLIIGRGAEEEIDCNLKWDKYISRHHARIEVEDENFLLTDLGSSHGTLVLNNKKEWIRVGKEGYYLMDGDTIQVGKTHLVLISKVGGKTKEEAIVAVDRLPYASLFEFEPVNG